MNKIQRIYGIDGVRADGKCKITFPCDKAYEIMQFRFTGDNGAVPPVLATPADFKNVVVTLHQKPIMSFLHLGSIAGINKYNKVGTVIDGNTINLHLSEPLLDVMEDRQMSRLGTEGASGLTVEFDIAKELTANLSVECFTLAAPRNEAPGWVPYVQKVQVSPGGAGSFIMRDFAIEGALLSQIFIEDLSDALTDVRLVVNTEDAINVPVAVLGSFNSEGLNGHGREAVAHLHCLDMLGGGDLADALALIPGSVREVFVEYTVSANCLLTFHIKSFQKMEIATAKPA